MKKILIIGGSGYVGTVLTEHFLSLGYNVKSFDYFIYDNNQCVLPFLGRKGFKHIYGDICSNKDLERALLNVSNVILLAGLVGDPITKKYPSEAAIINDEGVKNVMDLCAKHVDRFIFVSTCSNYGLIESDEIADENFVLSPLSLYAKSKVNAEKYILSLNQFSDMCSTILRFATAFGLSPRMRFDLTVNEFTRDLALSKELLVFDAHTWRPYCHVRDFAQLIQKVLEAPKEKIANQIFNAGGDANNCTKQMIVDAILDHLPGARVKYQEHGSDPRNYRVDFSKVKKILDFEPKYTVKDGIKEILDGIVNNVFDHVDKHRNFYGNYEINYPK